MDMDDQEKVLESAKTLKPGEEDGEQKEIDKEGVLGVEVSNIREGKAEQKQKKEIYLRADKINLADLDAALDRHLHRSWTAEQEGRRQKEEWEIDLRKLVLKNILARGTFGTVYRGVFDSQDVAVKLLDWGEESTMTKSEVEALRTAFRQEVAVWHKLNHPNVTMFIGASMGNSDLQIPSYEQGNDGFLYVASNVCCVVVEYLAGGTLKDFLIRHRLRKLTFKVLMQLVLDLSRGLSYLHSESIVHRDVKTENMLLDKKLKVKICDFGVARVEAKDMTGETGTLGYMAPELWDLFVGNLLLRHAIS